MSEVSRTPTISDVARRAGVGRGTVSRVLNERPNVDPDTRERVRDAIRELDYVPSASARRLSLGRTHTIAVVVPYLTRPSVVERLRGIERALGQAGLDMIVFNVETPQRRDEVLRDLPRPARIDGLILVSIAPHEHELRQIRQAALPVILVDAHHRSVPRVVVDDVGGGRLAARHLLDLGHVRIGFVGDPRRPPIGFSSSRLRLRGVEQAMRADGLAMPDELVALGVHGRQRARELASGLLLSSLPPTAIVAASDTQALGVLEAATDLGLQVPGDLSVIGYDDIEAADYAGLTTIHQPLEETGFRAVGRLLELMAGEPRSALREVLDVWLVDRRTTSPPNV
ncbi:MAG TPA: LacI family DNA-binding transcriptional regulator [Patescibacteria group bacterium]|nr:LacI family DNA-binding transcriptional regulator [Patescibacteria group bacterium]